MTFNQSLGNPCLRKLMRATSSRRLMMIFRDSLVALIPMHFFFIFGLLNSRANHILSSVPQQVTQTGYSHRVLKQGAHTRYPNRVLRQDTRAVYSDRYSDSVLRQGTLTGYLDKVLKQRTQTAA